jgi:hypothetical protein
MAEIIEFDPDGKAAVALLARAVRSGVEAERLAEVFGMPLPEIEAFAAGIVYADSYPAE